MTTSLYVCPVYLSWNKPTCYFMPCLYLLSRDNEEPTRPSLNYKNADPHVDRMTDTCENKTFANFVAGGITPGSLFAVLLVPFLGDQNVHCKEPQHFTKGWARSIFHCGSSQYLPPTNEAAGR